MSVVLTIIAAIAVFCLLILSHEFGHFIAAKACGVYVEDFSLGMGPKILKWQGKETMYALRAFPIGGWCKMRGEDEEDDDPRAFNRKKVWQRMLIIAAGPLMNFIFAIILFVIVFMMIGTYSAENMVGSVIADTPAAEAGLQNGDRIIEINGTTISGWEDISLAVNQNTDGETLALIILRDGTEQTVLITPYFNEEYGVWQIGIQPAKAQQNLLTAIGLGVEQSILFTKELIMALVQMITGKMQAEVSGPVGIVTVISEATSYGISSLILLTAYLCINLGLINLFPLPALDGSRLVFLAIEGLRGKPINRQKEGMIHFVGLMLLMAFMVIITYHDIVRLIAS